MRRRRPWLYVRVHILVAWMREAHPGSVYAAKALEMFLQMIVEEAAKVTSERGAKKVEAYHLYVFSPSPAPSLFVSFTSFMFFLLFFCNYRIVDSFQCLIVFAGH